MLSFLENVRRKDQNPMQKSRRKFRLFLVFIWAFMLFMVMLGLFAYSALSGHAEPDYVKGPGGSQPADPAALSYDSAVVASRKAGSGK